MLRDSMSTRSYMKSQQDKLPMPVNFGHPVAVNPTGEPSYIDGQVTDILVEIQEAPIKPFVEGEPIGILDGVGSIVAEVHGIPLAVYNRMTDRVWAAHKRLTRAAKRRSYTTDRTAAGEQFRFTWLPEVAAFLVRKLS